MSSARRGGRRKAAPKTKPKRTRKGMRPRFALGLGLLMLLLAVPAAMAGWSWWRLNRPYQGFAGAELTVLVEPGMGAAEILALLEREGVIADARLARTYLVYVLRDPPMLAGEYLFAGPASTPEVLGKLVRGEVVSTRVTLVEGLTFEESARSLADQGLGAYDALVAAMRDPAPISDLDPEAQDLEGYLFPETYTFAKRSPPEKVVRTLVDTFRIRWRERVAPRRAPGDARTLRELVTLASIVEKEAKVPGERPTIAAVYSNRIERGIGLFADPTVIYALKREGRWDGNLRRPDLEMDSPYNTYRYAGLPPGPICSPGLASLDAAARPAAVPYLYFVGRNDGTHVFAETMAEHNANVERWQRRYWREQRAAQRRGKPE
jgi:UPF0755 protein